MTVTLFVIVVFSCSAIFAIWTAGWALIQWCNRMEAEAIEESLRNRLGERSAPAVDHEALALLKSDLDEYFRRTRRQEERP